MKKITTKTLIPAKEVEETVYECENCGSKYPNIAPIKECSCCGKEICSRCEDIVYVFSTCFDTLTFNGSDEFYVDVDMKPVVVCKECGEKLKKIEKQYNGKIKELVKNFNSELKNLTEMYIASGTKGGKL